MKKIFFLIIFLLIPNYALADQAVVDNNYTKIACSNEVYLEVPKNTFSEGTFIECKISDLKHRDDFENNYPIYTIKILDNKQRRIYFSRNEIKVVYKNDIYPNNVRIFYYDDSQDTWLLANNQIKNTYISATLPRLEIFSLSISENNSQLNDIYYQASVIIFVISILLIIIYVILKI